MREIRQALIAAALIVGAALAHRFGLIENSDAAVRLMMVLVGFFLVTVGNAMPKTLKPLRDGRCDPAELQNFQRFSGWTWVMTGLSFAMVWLVLPADLARTVGTMVVLAGMLAVAFRLILLWRTRREA